MATPNVILRDREIFVIYFFSPSDIWFRYQTAQIACNECYCNHLLLPQILLAKWPVFHIIFVHSFARFNDLFGLNIRHHIEGPMVGLVWSCHSGVGLLDAVHIYFFSKVFVFAINYPSIRSFIHLINFRIVILSSQIQILLIPWLVAVMFMLAQPALGCDLTNCRKRPLYKCDLANCNGKVWVSTPFVPK